MQYQLHYYAQSQGNNVSFAFLDEHSAAVCVWVWIIFLVIFGKFVSVSQIPSHQAATESTSYCLSDEYLLPGVEYGARVRSRPNQGYYRGEWSDWSSEIHWKTEPAEPGESSWRLSNMDSSQVTRVFFVHADVISISFLSELGMELFLLCIMALLLFLLFLSFACVKM